MADARGLGETLVRLSAGGWLKLNRLADSLREVTRTSVLAERVVAEILDQLIAAWNSLPRDGHHVLSLQMELHSNLRTALTPEAQNVLNRVKGSGKGAKLAKQLCALTAEQPSQPMRLAAIEAAEGRLARGERIANYASM